MPPVVDLRPIKPRQTTIIQAGPVARYKRAINHNYKEINSL